MEWGELGTTFTFIEDTIGRPDGLHVGKIIYDRLNPSRVIMMFGNSDEEEVITKQKLLLFERGFLWEDILSHAFFLRQEHNPRPPAIIVDGIWCSPDGLTFTGKQLRERYEAEKTPDDPEFPSRIRDDAIVLREYKSTTRASTKPFAQEIYWHEQTRSYCYALSQTLGQTVNTVLFDIWYLRGDHRANQIGEYRRRWAYYPDEELAATWKENVQHAKFRGWL